MVAHPHTDRALLIICVDTGFIMEDCVMDLLAILKDRWYGGELYSFV